MMILSTQRNYLFAFYYLIQIFTKTPSSKQETLAELQPFYQSQIVERHKLCFNWLAQIFEMLIRTLQFILFVLIFQVQLYPNSFFHFANQREFELLLVLVNYLNWNKRLRKTNTLSEQRERSSQKTSTCQKHR